jgi:undecaprenyl-diphosphatase
MHSVSLILIWFPLYLAILVYLRARYKRRFPLLLLFTIITISLSDQLSLLIKILVERPRPCHDPDLQGLVHLVNGWCGGMYGFVSSHAANSFNVAFFSLMFVRKRWFTVFMIIWATVISYSRVYLGVHYPGDVVCGAIMGAVIGWGMYKLFELTNKNTLKKKDLYPQPPKGG